MDYSILQSSGDRGLRFSELKSGIEDISQKMLTVTLRALERDGLVTRTVFPEAPPRVEYKLTDLGLTLLLAMHGLMDWLQATWPVIQQNREQFDHQPSSNSRSVSTSSSSNFASKV